MMTLVPSSLQTAEIGIRVPYIVRKDCTALVRSYRPMYPNSEGLGFERGKGQSSAGTRSSPPPDG